MTQTSAWRPYLVVWPMFVVLFVCFWCDSPHWARASSFTRFLDPHNDAPQSVWLLWTSDQLVAETYTWQYRTLTVDVHAPDGIRTHNISRRAALDRAATETGTRICYWRKIPILSYRKFLYLILKIQSLCWTSNSRCSIILNKGSF
jgi:hypothetical protein